MRNFIEQQILSLNYVEQTDEKLVKETRKILGYFNIFSPVRPKQILVKLFMYKSKNVVLFYPEQQEDYPLSFGFMSGIDGIIENLAISNSVLSWSFLNEPSRVPLPQYPDLQAYREVDTQTLVLPRLSGICSFISSIPAERSYVKVLFSKNEVVDPDVLYFEDEKFNKKLMVFYFKTQGVFKKVVAGDFISRLIDELLTGLEEDRNSVYSSRLFEIQ